MNGVRFVLEMPPVFFGGKRSYRNRSGNMTASTDLGWGWDLISQRDCNQCHLASWGLHVPGSITSHYFHIIGDGHQPNSRGLYTHYKDSY